MVVVVVSLILYFCGITGVQQNAWSYVFSIALTLLIVGNTWHIQICSS
jgi:hypothetical protein